MRYVVIGPALACALAACATPVSAPTYPTPTQIATKAGALLATGLDPVTYSTVGYLINAEQCHDWMASLAQRQAGYSTASGLANVGTVGAAGIGAALGANPALGAIAAVGGGLAAGTLNVLSSSSGIAYPKETAALVRQAQATYLAGVALGAPATTLPEAALLVEGESWLCSLPGAEWLAAQAVASSQTSVAPTPAMAPRAFAAGAPVRGLAVPPRILVNGRRGE